MIEKSVNINENERDIESVKSVESNKRMVVDNG